VGSTSAVSAPFSAFFGADLFPQILEVFAAPFERMIREYEVPVYIAKVQ